MSWSSQIKKECIFEMFTLSERNFFNICDLSHCIQHIKESFRIYILLYIKKHYFIHFSACFKTLESLQCIITDISIFFYLAMVQVMIFFSFSVFFSKKAQCNHAFLIPVTTIYQRPSITWFWESYPLNCNRFQFSNVLL